VTEVVWTRQAVADIEGIHAYIARDSDRYATLVRERLVQSVDRLRAFPLSGRIVPEFGDESIREILWGSYRIVYRVRGPLAEVLTVFHGSRLLDRLPDGS